MTPNHILPPPLRDAGPLETMSEGRFIPFPDCEPHILGTGLLGATGNGIGQLEQNRLLVIERRILGIEASLRAAGIPVIRAPDAPLNTKEGE